MKKILLFLSLMLFCKFIFADTVSIQTARDYAIQFLKNKNPLKNTLEFSQEKEIQFKGKTVAFVFNASANGGYVVTSANNKSLPVLAYSLKGNFNDENMPPALQAWMDWYKNQLANIEKNTSKENSLWYKKQFKSSQATVLPLVKTTWNQSKNYYDSCPGQTLTGCVATMMAQIIKYYNFPSTGYHFHGYTEPTFGYLFKDFSKSNYNFSLMPNVLKDTTANNRKSEVQKLLYHCGVSVNMVYGYSGSSASTNTVGTVLANYFKYAPNFEYLTKVNYSNLEWESIIRNEINAGRPVIYRGANVDASSSHAFICDGYDNDTYFHFNWGWGGSSDGYFYLNDLTPGSNDFTFDQKAFIKIKPSLSPTLTYPYTQDFESGLPSEILTYQKAVLSTVQKQTGSQSLYFGDTLETCTNRMYLKINVPANGAILSFWVKRSYDYKSVNCKHIALIKPEYWVDTQSANIQNLDTIFLGDSNDVSWKKYTWSLNPWKGKNITLFFEQSDKSTTYDNSMYIDNIVITQNPTSNKIISKENIETKIYSWKHKLIIESKSGKNEKVKIYDILGKLIYEDEIQNYKEIEIKYNGIYIVSLTEGIATLKKKILIKD